MSALCPKCGGRTKTLSVSGLRVCVSSSCDAPPFAVEDLDALFDDRPTLRTLPPDTSPDISALVYSAV